MAQTLPNGVVVPNADGSETISATGVQEMRTLGASVDAALATKTTPEYVDSTVAPVSLRANLPLRTTTNGMDLNAQYESQLLRHTTATGVLNLPDWGDTVETAITFIQVLNGPGSNTYGAQVAYRYGAQAAMAWRASRNTMGLWQPWQIVRMRDDELDDAPARHLDLVARARARRDGRIGTGGVPAVALRFDHHTGPWASKVLPILEELGLPWAQAINPARVGTGDDTMTYAELQAAALRSGGEVWNHGGNHGDATYKAEAVREIATALVNLAAGVPRLVVEGWAPPGLADGAYMGAAGFRTTDENTGTYTGQMIIRNHAFVAGYADGVYRTLDPSIQPIGAPHVTIDKATPAQVASTLNAAGSDGVALMLHPNFLDEEGYMTTAQLRTALEDIAARRDAGTLKVLTYSGLWVADASTNYRGNLLRTAPVEKTGSWSGTWSVYRRNDRLGSVREVAFLAKSASATTATIAVAYGSETVTRTRPIKAGTGWQEVVAPVTIPANLTDSDTVTVTINTGTATQRDQVLRAI